MKIKELTLTAIFVASLVIQNYVLFNFPITLTYTIFYFLTKKLENKKLSLLAVIVFVIIKNILTPALFTTIIADLFGLLFFVVICRINNKTLSYILIPIVILIHILLLDFSTAILIDGNIIKTFIANIGYGFITYIYAPLSIFLIIMVDSIETLTNIEKEI